MQRPISIKSERIKGAYRSPGELVETIYMLQRREIGWMSEKINHEDLSDRKSIRRLIRNTYGIDRETRRAFLDECNRLFSIEEMART